MADISITAANVLASNAVNPTITSGTAGATITAGQAVYLDSATNTYKLADANDTAAKAAVVGIALNGAASGQPLSVQKAGDITIGGTLAAGEIYILSTTAGGICPAADLATASYGTILGVAKSTTVLSLSIKASGIQKA